ncbi:N-(5'-phosphoribosyl)anthranilate isomerase [Aureispira]|nr:N-(5'-phosphoribosyl)anthranilate isomerase [Aureispira sp.]
MKIKASSINNLTDARYFAAWNVEWLGFSLESGHSNYTPPQDVKEIKEWLVGPKIVGEFGVGQSLAEIKSCVELLNLDAIQLGMFSDITMINQLSDYTIIREWVLENLTELDQFGAQCADLAHMVNYFYLDLEKNGISWQDLRKNENAVEQLIAFCKEYPILISLVCPPSELKDFLDCIQPHGISLQGGEEEKVGIKSFDDLDEIYDVFEALDYIH